MDPAELFIGISNGELYRTNRHTPPSGFLKELSMGNKFS